MDHLKTSQERKDRWLARHVSPSYVPTKAAESWEDLWKVATSDHDNIFKSLPYAWLCCSNHDCEKGISLSQRIHKVINCHGFLIISGVLNENECDLAMAKAWDWIEAASDAELQLDHSAETGAKPVHRQDPSTLASEYYPRSVEGGMMPFYGSGHSRFAWTIRSNPKVKRVFEAIHNDEKDLLASMDGIVLWREGCNFRTDPGWFHLDQNPRHKPDPCGIQGLVNILPTSQQTGGNVIVAQSHKLFPHHYNGETQHGCSDFYRQRLDELGDEDWMEIDPNDSVLLGGQSRVISCMLGPGDMLLWDSRTVHCSYPAAQQSTDATTPERRKSCLIRVATVVSMMPAKGVPEVVLRARKLAVEQSRTLTHWVDKVAPLGEEHLDHAQREKACVTCMKQRSKVLGVPCTLLEFEDLTEAQRNLVVGGAYNK